MDRQQQVNEFRDTIQDSKNKDFEFKISYKVPSINDTDLTYESGKAKKGKEITTCVLYVDIRNSVALTEKHQIKTMGRIYTAFTKCVLKAARDEDGYVRNIIGDRVMVVFPSEKCFEKAVNCAISINHAAKILNKEFVSVDFKCGIGIDYGKMNVIKVGIERKGDENTENKGLVWVGCPANYASRLTDNANKHVEIKMYSVEGKMPNNPLAYFSSKKEYTADQFAEKVKYSFGKITIGEFQSITNIKEYVKSHDFSPILISEEVLNGLKKESKNLVNNYWKKEVFPIRNVDVDVFGTDLTWKVTNKNY